MAVEVSWDLSTIGAVCPGDRGVATVNFTLSMG